MIFASDLDHTLIHPLRTLAPGAEGEATVVEELDARPLSYIPSQALAMLADLAADHVFIPVTSRSMRQLARVSGILTLAQGHPVICTNGATVLLDGRPDPVWNAELARRLAPAASLAQATVTLTRALGAPAEDHWLLRSYTCDEAYWYGIVDLARLPADAVDRARAALDPLDWSVVLHGRKLYALPRAMSKEAALEFVVAAHSLPGPLVCAGDSVLDAGMLALADLALAPAGTPVTAVPGLPHLVTLEGSPLDATPALVERALAAAADGVR